MNFFNKLGYYVIKLFSLIGKFIQTIPDKIKNIDSVEIRERIDTENIKNNISNIKDDIGIDKKLSQITKSEKLGTPIKDNSDSGVLMINNAFTADEKERTILILQILSASFIVISILNVFNFLSFFIYLPIGIFIIAIIIYLMYSRVKLMYRKDFPAYRDFFLMYVAVGIILIIINSNPSFTSAFSFQLLPNLTVLIYALIGVLAVYVIFRIRYYRNFTYGIVLDSTKNTAHVKVDYDIRSNVKPDIYIVENFPGAYEGELVKLKLDSKLLSMGGNKPVSIIERFTV